MSKFELAFDIESFNELDTKIALLACQDYNFGNEGDWFGAFRGWLFWFYSRIGWVKKHYFTVHEWIQAPKDPEYELSAIMFHMDSALECLIYAINALWNCVDKNIFIDIWSEKSLRKICPTNILGNNERWIYPISWYLKYFPLTQEYWKNNIGLIEKLTELHDVSKHRETIYIWWKCRLDSPKGFFESMGIYEEYHKWPFLPMEEIILMGNPKIHRLTRLDWNLWKEWNILLEDFAIEFTNFINKTWELLLTDSKMNIKLKYSNFQ